MPETTEPENADEPSGLVGGRYRLRGRLGTGTTGVVWSGYDELLHRSVAVKQVQLPAGLAEQDAAAARERTLREARAVAALNQQNVITVYDVVTTGQAPFVVMELVDGHSLAERLNAGGRMGTAATAAVADGVAAALQAAHGAGVTHRDVKPGNVLLGNGEVKLTDFGIARSVAEPTMTRTGVVLGSPAYMAPEVAEGRRASPEADLWSLGATLYASATGAPPYAGEGGIVATMHEIVHGPVPSAGVDGPLGEVIAGLMAKDPADRMDLLAVRRLVHPLLPAPGEPLFDLSAMGTLVTPATPAPQKEPPQADDRRDDRGDDRHEESASPLAGDPGPLPFAPSDPRTPDSPSAPRTRGRRRPPAVLVAAAAAVLFYAGGAATFAAARTLGGQKLLPHQRVVTVPAAPQALGRLVRREGSAETLNGSQGGGFSVLVPQGWSSFVEPLTSSALPAGSVVHFVSRHGKQEIGVQRVPEFFPGDSVDGYLGAVAASWPPGGITTPSTTPRGDGSVDFRYRTVEYGPADELGRTTFGRTVRDGTVLWVVRVRVPTDQEDRGYRRLFARIAPSFRPEGG